MIAKIIFYLFTPIRIGIALLIWFVGAIMGEYPQIDWKALIYEGLDKGIN